MASSGEAASAGADGTRRRLRAPARLAPKASRHAPTPRRSAPQAHLHSGPHARTPPSLAPQAHAHRRTYARARAHTCAHTVAAFAKTNALSLAAAAAGIAATAWLGLTGFAWSDYETEVARVYAALAQGHVAEALRIAPVYGGSLVLRAPFALLPGLWGGGAQAIFRVVALPCLAAAAALGVWLVADMRRRNLSRLARGVALALCVANPVTVGALEVGHPEDLLGGAACVAAVLCAARGRAAWAGVLLGAAVANKEWALLAAGPVLLALPAGRARCAVAASATAAAIVAPLAVVHAGNFVAETKATSQTSSAIFQPWQWWWFFGHHGGVVKGTFGRVKPGYRTGPAWAGTVSHPLVLAAGVALPAALWWSRRRRATSRRCGERDALLLLALLLLARCTLDTWDTQYYIEPLLLALCAWEARGARGLPTLAIATTALAWIDFEWLRYHASADAQAAVFLMWTIPLAAALAAALFSRRAAHVLD